MISLLLALSPLLVKLGLGWISMVTSDNEAKAKAQQDFINAVQSSLNGASLSVKNRDSYDEQVADLKKGDKNV
jgi:hypothetical protein